MRTTAARQPQEAAAKTAKIKATAPKPALAVRRGTARDAEADNNSATNAAPSAASPRPLSVDGRAGEANSAPNRANERAGKRKTFAPEMVLDHFLGHVGSVQILTPMGARDRSRHAGALAAGRATRIR